MRAAEDVKREIVKRYDKDPKGWQVYAGRDVKGHYDMMVAHGSEAWIIKEEQINPFKFVGFGTRSKKMKLEPVTRDIQYPFGIRSVSERQMKRLAEALEDQDNIKDMLTQILDSKPVPSHEAKGPMVIQGPVMYSAKPINTISERQRQLDLKLRLELEGLLNRRYPQVLRPYI